MVTYEHQNTGHAIRHEIDGTHMIHPYLSAPLKAGCRPRSRSILQGKDPNHSLCTPSHQQAQMWRYFAKVVSAPCVGALGHPLP